MTIRILPPDPTWPARFQALKALIQPILPPGALIHHIGSTAVPGLAAKDIIDIQVTLPALTTTPHAALTGLGLERRPPEGDHCPPGLSLPSGQLAKYLYRAMRPFAGNIHFRAQGTYNQRYALLCRDYLRANPQVAATYQLIKQELATRFPQDAESYYSIKDPVFDLIMAAAEPWANATRWTKPGPD